jgi:hypothetical protein
MGIFRNGAVTRGAVFMSRTPATWRKQKPGRGVIGERPARGPADGVAEAAGGEAAERLALLAADVGAGEAEPAQEIDEGGAPLHDLAHVLAVRGEARERDNSVTAELLPEG